jgi:hypothetical protein
MTANDTSGHQEALYFRKPAGVIEPEGCVTENENV